MQLGRYRLLSQLGEGGMATVFAALDTSLNREVALKVLFPHLAMRAESAGRFRREAKAAAALDHPHILRVLDVGGGECVDGVQEPSYIVMERIVGETLTDFFAKRSQPLAEVVAAIGAALCSALDTAHCAGIVHRDIKPDNVMVTAEGRLVLADFGIARFDEKDSVVTKTGAVLGTPAFMSPEQAYGEKVDARSDLYSLGATLYTVATGSLPYKGAIAEVVAAMLRGQCPRVEERAPFMGRELSRVIEKLMSLTPAQRFASAQEVEHALSALVTKAGFADVETVLRDFLGDPDGHAERNVRKVTAALVERACALRDEGQLGLATSLVDRVLCLAPDNRQAQELLREFAWAPRRRKVVAGSIGLVLAVLGVWGITAVNGASKPVVTPEPVELSDASRALAKVAASRPTRIDAGNVIPITVDAGFADDGKTRRQTPRPSPKSQRQVRGETADASVEMPSDATSPLPPGSLVVDIRPWCDVWIDGKRRGRSSATREYSVNIGQHRVVCVQPGTQHRWEEGVIVSAGQRLVLKGSVLGGIRVQVRVRRDRRIRIHGKTYQRGDVVQLPAARYRIEILAMTGQVEETAYLTLRRDCVLQDEPKVVCFGH